MLQVRLIITKEKQGKEAKRRMRSLSDHHCIY